MNRLPTWFPGHRLAPLAVVMVLLCGLPPALLAQRMALLDPRAEPVVVETASVSTEISGRIAVTTFDLVFRNPNARVLEGTFEFPLLDGQSVVRFALDINGHLREAVPVEKTRARVVFEEIERRGVDPGMLEKTAGNNYRARVFPLPAGGTRRLVIAYQEDIADGAGGPVYRLPLDFRDPLERFEFSADVFAAGSSIPTATTTLALDLPPWQEARRLAFERRKFVARGVLEVTLPRLERPGVLTERRGGREYFYAELPVTGAAIARPAPKVVGLLWDASGSGRAREHVREFALLDAWFAAVGDTEVRLIELRDTASMIATFTINAGDWSALRARLERTIYDGATSLDGLVDDPAVDEWLLFSDGLFNYGVTRGGEHLPLKKPVHTVLASPRADPSWLRALAMRHAGEHANLLSTDAVIAAGKLREQSLRIIGIDAEPDDVGQVFPEVGAPVAPGTLVVTGLLRQSKAKVRVWVGHHADDADAFDVTLRSGENAGHLAARGWAAAKIDALSLNFAANREDIRRTSCEFGIVTANTSLLVLETIEDYARFEITPPPELRDEWERRVRFANNNRVKERETHLDRVARAWAERVQWWETKFPQRGFRADDKDRGDGLRRRDRRNVPLFGAAAAPSSSPSPAEGGADGGATVGGNRGGGVEAGDAMPEDEETIALSPFQVSTEREDGYAASNTIAGARVRTEARDLAESITVVTPEMLRDAGATDSETLLQYTTNTEIGATAGAMAGAIGEAPPRTEAERLEQERTYQEELAKRRAQEARFRTAIDEELAVAAGYRLSDAEIAETTIRAEEFEVRLRQLQAERQAALRRSSEDGSVPASVMAAEQEIAALEAGLAELRGETSSRGSIARLRTVRPNPSRRPPVAGRLYDPWSGDTGFLDRFGRADRKRWYAVYLDERPDHARQPGFYLEVAQFFLEHDETVLGLRVLSNLAELSLEDAPLLRVLGHRLAQAGRADLARPIFERVLEIRGEEPQSRRDLALVCAQLGDAQRAVDLLWEVVATPWHDRFPDIEMVALGELNAIAASCRGKVDLAAIDSRLRRNLACGLRVIVTWDADNADIDLWIDDPSGERCIYNHPRTAQGGRMSRDFTQGYGPEEFLLRAPRPGKYRIHLNYYGDRRQTALGPITAQVRVITGFGTPDEREERHTVRLASARDTIDIGSVTF